MPSSNVILRMLRGDPAPESTMNSMPQTPAAPAQGVPQDFLPNPGLEQNAQMQGNAPLHPLIQSILSRFGLLNLIRNRALQPYGQAGGP